MQEIIFKLNPIIYLIAITLLVMRYLSMFIMGGCFDCEPTPVMIVTKVWSFRIGIVLFVWTIGVSVIKKLHKK